MTLQETMAMAKAKNESRRPAVLKAKMSVDELFCDEITNLLIRHDFEGEIPDLSRFPMLESFSCTLPLTMEYIARQDLTKLKEIRVSFENGAGAICILAPALETLAISIRNNQDPQLDMFTCHENSIFVGNMPHLKRLELRWCTGHRIIVNETMPSVEEVVFCNSDYLDFGLLKHFPNLRELTVAGCTCRSLDFTRDLTGLKKLDVSYNYISDISPLLSLPELEKVNIYKNEVKDYSQLREAGCTVVATLEDSSFERFKSWLTTVVFTSYRHVMVDEWREVGDLNYDDLFVRHFSRAVKMEIDRYSGQSKGYFYTPVPIERLEKYVRDKYPFVEL